MSNVIYEPHPVSPERKRELVSQGYRIIDAKFAPEGHKPAQKSESGAKKAAKAKAADSESGE
jgi:hypothetical protein